MPPDGPELVEQREQRRAFDQDWTTSSNIIASNTTLEPLAIDIWRKSEESEALEKRSEEDLLKEITQQLDRPLQYAAWELQGLDIEEEEEDNEAAEQEEEEEAMDEEAVEEEEEDPNRSQKKPLGDVSYFCPVALKENDVLWPGDPEIAAKYREKTYYLSSREAREKFLENPSDYLPKDKAFVPPPIRILILGPRGSGKTQHGRSLANKLGIFHIQFHERLQELVIAKTKLKVGPEYEEDQKADEELDQLEAEEREE